MAAGIVVLFSSALFDICLMLVLKADDNDGSEKAETSGVAVRSAHILEPACDFIMAGSVAEVVEVVQGRALCD